MSVFPDDPRHAELRALGHTKHCGSSMCTYTLPDPDAWTTALLTNPDYDPECCCPCLGCHPADVAYDNALRVVRLEYGEKMAGKFKAAREAVLKGRAA